VTLKDVLAHKFIKNFSYLTIGSILGQLMSLLAIYKLTRLINPEYYGIYTYLISQGLLLVRVSSFGNNSIVVREISRNISITKTVFTSTLIYRLIIIFGSSILYIIYDAFFGNLTQNQIGLLIIFAIISSITYIFEWAFTGQQKLQTVAYVNLAGNIVWLMSVLFFVTENSSPTHIYFLYLLSFLLKVILYLIFSVVNKIFENQQLKEIWKEGFRINKISWPYFVMILLLLPMSNLDNNFLDLNSTNSEIGFFNLAKRLIGPLSLMNTMLITAIFPNISSIWFSNREKFLKILSNGFPVFILVGGLVCFSFSIFCEELIRLLFDDEYLAAIAVCQIQVWYFLFFSIDFLMGTFLGASNHEKTVLKFAFIYFVVCAPAMYFGSYYGAIGISIALLASFVASMFFTWRMFKRKVQLKMKASQNSFILIFALIAISFLITHVYHLNIIYKIIFFVILGFYISVKAFKQFKKFSI